MGAAGVLARVVEYWCDRGLGICDRGHLCLAGGSGAHVELAGRFGQQRVLLHHFSAEPPVCGHGSPPSSGTGVTWELAARPSRLWPPEAVAIFTSSRGMKFPLCRTGCGTGNISGAKCMGGLGRLSLPNGFRGFWSAERMSSGWERQWPRSRPCLSIPRGGRSRAGPEIRGGPELRVFLPSLRDLARVGAVSPALKCRAISAKSLQAWFNRKGCQRAWPDWVVMVGCG